MNDAEGPLLLMAQIDDAPGELLGYVVDELARMGAKNVQLLSSLGKKGRPGYVLLVDIEASDEEAFAGLLVGELGVWGYRVLAARHRHFEVRRYDTTLELHRADQVHSVPLRVKRILCDGRLVRVKAEHDDLVAAVESLRDGAGVPLSVIKAEVEVAVGGDEPGEVVRVNLDAGVEERA